MDDAVDTAPATKKPFAALRIVAGIFEFLAWGALVVTPIAAAAVAEADKYSANPTPTALAFFLGLLSGGFGWLVFMFAAQSITVILAIEENTRLIARK